MGFSPFNHYYALFAALTSALVGLKEIRSRITEILTNNFASIIDAIDEHTQEVNSITNQAKSVVKSYVSDENYDDAIIPILKGITKMELKTVSFGKMKEALNVDIELENTQKKMTAVHVYIFLFSINILLIAGFCEAGFISENLSFTLVGNCELLSSLPIAYVLLFLNKKSNVSCLVFSTLWFLIVLTVSILESILHWGWIDTNKLSTEIISLIICASPLILILFYAYTKWYFKRWHFEWKLKREKSYIAKIAEKIMESNNL